MEKFQECMQAAKKAFQTADHFAYVTYPLLSDTKLIIPIAENLYLGATSAMDAVLQYDKFYKKIDNLTDDFDIRFTIFKNECAKRYNIQNDYINLITELKAIMAYHKNSTMEFTRKSNVVLYRSNLNMKTVNLMQMKSYIARLKQFLAKIDSIAVLKK